MENSATNQTSKTTDKSVKKIIKLITTAQAQKMLGYKSRSAIYRLIDLCLLPKTFRNEDGTFLFEEQDIKNLISYRNVNKPNNSVTKLSDVKNKSHHVCCGECKKSEQKESAQKESAQKKSAQKKSAQKKSAQKESVAQKIKLVDVFAVDVPLEYFRKSKENDAIFQKKYLGLAAMTVWAPQELLIRFKEKVQKQQLKFRTVFREFFENYIGMNN